MTTKMNTITSKQKTGFIIEAREFRRMNRCVECGIIADIKPDSRCSSCDERNLPKCFGCEAILRDDFDLFFSYDIQNMHRDGELKVSKKPVVEYYYVRLPHSRRLNDVLCSSCHNIPSRIKNVCFTCDSVFDNNVEHYIKYGNTCYNCSNIYG